MEALRPSLRDVPVVPAVAALRRLLRGPVITPDDPRYEAARVVHNLGLVRRPAAIVRPVDAEEVARVIVAAREADVELAIRSGGHSVAGHSTTEGGLVLDLSAMKGLHIDPDRRLAWAQPGLTAGEYTTAAAAHGLATPFGDTGSVGLGGITLGGGIGWLVRKHGLTIDSLVSAEIVTADGCIVTASADVHPDLFWAIRGGGGNFGVVTRFEYRLHRVDTVLGGALFLPPTPEVLRGLIDAATAAPEELTTITMLMPAPPLPFVPAEHHGRLTALVMLVYAGDPEEGQAAVAPLRALAEPIADVIAPMPYPGIYEFMAEAAKPVPNVVRSTFADDLDDAAIATILDRLAAPSSPGAMAQLRILGGAMARVSPGATAFAHRDARVLFATIVEHEGDRAPHVAWSEELLGQLKRLASGAYANFLDREGEARIREAYPGSTFCRLAALKRRWDPDNVFRLNQNIAPREPAVA